MTRSSALTLLLVCAICSLANIVLCDLGFLASLVLCIILMANAKKVFGAEGKSVSTSSLINLIAGGVLLVIGGGFCAVITLFTGIGAVSFFFLQGFIFMLNIAIGIWQLVAWNNLKKSSPQAAAAYIP